MSECYVGFDGETLCVNCAEKMKLPKGLSTTNTIGETIKCDICDEDIESVGTLKGRLTGEMIWRDDLGCIYRDVSTALNCGLVHRSNRY